MIMSRAGVTTVMGAIKVLLKLCMLKAKVDSNFDRLAQVKLMTYPCEKQ